MPDAYRNVKVPPDKEFCPHLQAVHAISKLVLELDEPEMHTDYGGTIEVDKSLWRALVKAAREATR